MGQLVTSSVATGSGVVQVWGGLGNAWRRGHGPPGPFPLCWQRCCGGGSLPFPGLVSAPGWGMPACAVLALCINKPPWPESSASPWALGGQVGKLYNHRGAHIGMAPRTGCPELSLRVFKSCCGRWGSGRRATSPARKGLRKSFVPTLHFAEGETGLLRKNL